MTVGTKRKTPDAADVGAAVTKALHDEGGESPDVLTPPVPPTPMEEATGALEAAAALVRDGDMGAHLAPPCLAAWKLLRAEAPEEYARRRAALRGLVDLRELDRLAKAPRSVHVAGADDAPPCFGELLPGCPVAPDLRVPFGFVVTPDRVSRRRMGEQGPYFEPVASAPVAIVGRLVGSDGVEHLRVAWLRGEQWRTFSAPRGAWLEPRRLAGLADVGVPVWGGSAGALAEYLHDLEAQNLDVLPAARVSESLGWQGKHGEQGFLLGRDLLTPAGEMLIGEDLDTLDPCAWGGGRVHFQPAGIGEGQLADALVPSGTFEAWRAGAAEVASFPRVVFGLYASLAAPLLAVVRDVSNFVVDWSWPTSTGKTTVLRLAASVWGSPADGVPESFLHSWDSTAVFLERAASTLNGLPLLLDDSKRVKKGADVAALVYGFAQGQGRGRGQKGEGTRKTRAFRSLLLSTGETPLTGFTQDGGTRARVLSLAGPPFGKANEETGRVVLALKRALAENHGHAGRRFVAWLLAHRDEWPSFRRLFRSVHGSYAERAGGAPVAARLAEPVALIETAASLAHDALDLPWKVGDPIGALWDDLTREATDADRAETALQAAYSWACQHPKAFYGRHEVTGINSRPLEPFQGWAGRWDGEDDWPFVAFFPDRLARVLRDVDLDPDAMVRAFDARGWIDPDVNGRNSTRRLRGPWGVARMILLRRSALVEVCDAARQGEP